MVFYRVLELAVGHQPVRYRDLGVNPKSKPRPPTPTRGTRPPADLGPATRRAPVASVLTWSNGYP